jgi:2,4-dienoyl-CoA reductase-like NADH-dependent reductase (Old Yellow Enzyme family)
VSYSSLFTPLSLSGRELQNRIVMPPMVIWKAGKDGKVTEDHLAHYRACGGAGITVVEATAVSPEGRLAATELGLFADEQVPGMQRLAATIAETGSLPGIQLLHAGGKTNTGRTYGLTPLVVSHTNEMSDAKRELTSSDIERILGDFAAAARRAVAAGFKLLELHGAHGYLGAQFLSPKTNRRTDGWGGSFEKRLRFLLELVRRMRAEVGQDALLSVRLGVAEGGTDGLGVEEGTRAAEILTREGLDLIHVSHAGSRPEALDPASPYEPLLQLARPVRERVAVPVIGIGGIKTPAEADRAIEDGMCDLIAVGRAILADPGWVRKTTQGRPESIALCEDCEPRCYHYTEPEKCPARKRLVEADA